jgi:hypothetical protein
MGPPEAIARQPAMSHTAKVLGDFLRERGHNVPVTMAS